MYRLHEFRIAYTLDNILSDTQSYARLTDACFGSFLCILDYAMVCLTELPNCLCPGALHLHCVLLGSGMYTWLKHCGLRKLNFETNAVSLVMESHGDMDTA